MPVAAAAVIALATLEKMVEMLVATPGITAPAVTATKPAIRAYSIRSCPWVSFHSFNFRIALVKVVIVSFSSVPFAGLIHFANQADSIEEPSSTDLDRLDGLAIQRGERHFLQRKVLGS